MPGRSLTRPCPGTGRRLLSSESPPPPSFRYSARVGPLSPFESRGCNSPARVGGWFWRAVRDGKGNSALRASVYKRVLSHSQHSCFVSTARRRPHCAGHIERESASSRACDTTLASLRLRFALPLRMRRQTAGFGASVTPVTLLVPARLGLRSTATPNTADCPGAVARDSELSVSCTPLRTALAIGA